MNIPDNILSGFAKSTIDRTPKEKEYTTYATVTAVDANGNATVKFDGSNDITTFCVTTVPVKTNDRVLVTVKDRAAVITSNVSTKTITADYLVAGGAQFKGTLLGADGYFSGELQAATGSFKGELRAATGTFAGSLSAAKGTFGGELQAAKGTFAGELRAATGTFDGTLNAAKGSFAGELQAATGTFAGNLQAAKGTFDGELRAATGTFAGNLQAAKGTFDGELRAATGSFAGNLSAAKGTFAGELQAATGSFDGVIAGDLRAATGSFSGVLNAAEGMFSGTMGFGYSKEGENAQSVVIGPAGLNYEVYDFHGRSIAKQIPTWYRYIRDNNGFNAPLIIKDQYYSTRMSSTFLAFTDKRYYDPTAQNPMEYYTKITADGTETGTIGGDSYKMDRTGFHSPSDRRLKENIKDIDGDIALNLKPVSFNYKNDKRKKKRYGFIAQDVKEVLPSVVSKDEENWPQYYSIQYMELIAPTLALAQRNAKKIEELEKEIADLKEIINGKT